METQKYERGLFWKEWRAKRVMLIALGVLLLLSPYIASWFYTVFEESSGFPDISISDTISGSRCLVFLFGVFVIGAMFLTKEEHDPARSFLYALPIPRHRIVGMKLLSSFSHVAVLAIAFFVISDIHLTPTFRWIALSVIIGSVVVIPLVAIFNLHFRSVIVTVLLSVIFLVPIVLIFFSHGVDVYTGQEAYILSIRSVFDCLITAAALLGWVFFVFCRTPLQELNGTARALLGLLFGVVTVEILFTVLLCNFRDLAFIVFGI